MKTTHARLADGREIVYFDEADDAVRGLVLRCLEEAAALLGGLPDNQLGRPSAAREVDDLETACEFYCHYIFASLIRHYLHRLLRHPTGEDPDSINRQRDITARPMEDNVRNVIDRPSFVVGDHESERL